MAQTMSRAVLFAETRPIFGGALSQPQVDGINAILDAWEKHGDGNPRHLAYILSTAKHETASTMQPVRETLAKTDAKAKERLTKAWKSGKLKVSRDYWSGGYFGRGFVQLTHKANYAKAGKALGIDLVGNPSLALDPAISAAILVRGMLEGWFTGKKLADFPHDFVESRRIVNGTDKAVLIAGYAYRFLDAIEKAEAAVVIPSATPIPDKPTLPRADDPAGKGAPSNVRGWLGIIILALSAIGAGIAVAWDWLTAFIERIF